MQEHKIPIIREILGSHSGDHEECECHAVQSDISVLTFHYRGRLSHGNCDSTRHLCERCLAGEIYSNTVGILE